MHIIDFAAQIQIGKYLPILLCILIVIFLIFKKLLFHLTDPAVLILLSLSFGLANVIYSNSVDEKVDTWVIVYLTFTYIAFFVGAHLLHRNNRQLCLQNIKRSIRVDSQPSIGSERLISVLLFVSTLLLVIAIAARAVTTGLSIFAENPETQKVLANAGGLGLIQRVLNPCVECSLVLCFYRFHYHRRITPLLFIGFLVPLFALFVSGAKAALFTVYYAYFFANTYICLRDGKPFTFVSLKVVFLAIFGVLGYAFLVLFLRAVGTGVIDINSFIVDTLFTRFVAYGDGIYYFFSNPRLNELISFSPGSYLYDYVLVPLLAPMRLIPYSEQTLGTMIAQTLFGPNTLGGPNPTFSVEGFVYFSSVGGVVYGFLLGCLFSILRTRLFDHESRKAVVSLLIFCSANSLALKIPTDMLLVMAGLLEFVVVIGGMLVFSSIVIKTTRRPIKPASTVPVRINT